MRAGVFTGDGHHEVRTFPEPDPPPGGAVLQVEAVGLCGSDLAQHAGGVGVPGETFPVVPGHETVGRVAKLTREAAEAWGLAEGDRVCVDEILRCGDCAACRAGAPDCAAMQVYGYTMGVDDGLGLWGGYGEMMAILPRTNLHPVPEELPAAELTMFEPLANAVAWVERAGIRLGDLVVIEGPGHQGLACLVAARAAGARVVVTGTDGDALRLDTARRLGATATINVDEDDVVARVADLTAGRMADVVMDIAAVTTATIPLALRLVRNRGTVLLAGLKHFQAVEGFISDLVVFRQLSVLGAAGYTPASMRAAVAVLTSDDVDRVALLGETVTLDSLDDGLALLGRTDPTRDAVHVSLLHP